MPFRDQKHYPPETLAMMYRVLDECVAVLIDGHPPDRAIHEGMRTRLARIILGAVAAGETDPVAIKQIVLRDFQLPKP
jgi:hypothetical protein